MRKLTLLLILLIIFLSGVIRAQNIYFPGNAEKWETQLPGEFESYNYMWWLNKGVRKILGVPKHIFYAAEFGGNYIVVDQINNFVIVTRWFEPSKMGQMIKLVYEAIN